MQGAFQSRDIQKMLKIPKQRVEYLALKVPIKPEIEQVEGTGRAHLYSFKNALQFAIAEAVAKGGLGITDIRMILEYLDNPTRSKDFFSMMWMGTDYDRLFKKVRDYYLPHTNDKIYISIYWFDGLKTIDVIEDESRLNGFLTSEAGDTFIVIKLAGIKKAVVSYA